MLESVSRTAAPVLFVDAALAPALGRALGPAVDLTDDVAGADVALVMLDAASMRELRQLYPAASVLAVVGVPAHHGGSDLAVELLNSGADACVIRPTGVELRAHLNALLRRRP